MHADVCIAAAVRTPMGSFQGSLACFSATDLGAFAIRGVRRGVCDTALERARQWVYACGVHVMQLQLCM